MAIGVKCLSYKMKVNPKTGEQSEVKSLQDEVDKLREEVVNFLRMAAPDCDKESALHCKVLTTIKWMLCFTLGFGLVTYLSVTLDSDPFVLGTQTQEIQTLPFPSVGVTPKVAVKNSYYRKVQTFVQEKFAQKSITSPEYKNWTTTAANKLAVLLFQICGAQKTYLSSYKVTNSNTILPVNALSKERDAIDDPEDPDWKNFVVPDIKQGIANCHDTVRMVTWNNINSNALVKFRKVVTDAGITCVVNSVPLRATERNKTLKSALSSQESADELASWRSINFDDFSHNVNTPVLKQLVPGQRFGLSFVVKEDKEEGNSACKITDGDGFRLTLTHPRDLHQVRQYSKTLSYGYEHWVIVAPEARFVELDVAAAYHVTRKCCLKNECVPDGEIYAYSQTHCLALCLTAFIYEKCNCTTIHSYGSAGQRLCDSEGYKCYVNKLDNFYRQQVVNCAQCKPSCNNIKYSAEITSVPLPNHVLKGFEESMGTNISEFAVVHVYYAAGIFDATVMKLRRLFGEFFGIATGTLGAAAEITLPKIWDLILALLGIVFTAVFLLWKKCRKHGLKVISKACELLGLAKRKNSIPSVQITQISALSLYNHGYKSKNELY